MKLRVITKRRFQRTLRFVMELYHDDSGAVATEYVIITGLLAVALIGVADAFADAARLWFWRKVLIIITDGKLT